MQTLSGGNILFAGGHALSPEVFGLGSLRLLVRNAEPDWRGGPIVVCLWEAEAGFPWRRRLACRTSTIDPGAGEKSVVFLGLRPGRYAVTAFADRRRNGFLPRAFFGWPSTPVFLTASMPWRRKMRFDDYAQRISQSTILELRLASAELGFGSSNYGDKNNEYARRSGQNATLAGTDCRSPAPAHRR